MGFDKKTLHGGTWEHTFDLPRLDVQNDPRTQSPTRCSRLRGVDGRYSGRLKRFPGFFRKYDALPNPCLEDANGATLPDDGEDYTLDGTDRYGNTLKFMKPFAIQLSPGSADIVRGIVFLVQMDDDGTTRDRLYVYYSIQDRQNPTGSTPKLRRLFAFSPTTTEQSGTLPVNYQLDLHTQENLVKNADFQDVSDGLEDDSLLRQWTVLDSNGVPLELVVNDTTGRDGWRWGIVGITRVILREDSEDGTTALRQDGLGLIAGVKYKVTYTLDYTSGGVKVNLGGTNGLERTADATYTEVLEAGSGDYLEFIPLEITSDLPAISNIVVEPVVTGTNMRRVNSIDMTADHGLLHFVGEVRDADDPTGATRPNSEHFELLARFCGDSGGWRMQQWRTEQPSFVNAPIVRFFSYDHRFAGASPTSRSTIFNQDVADLNQYNYFNCALQASKSYGVSFRFVYPDQGYVGPLFPVGVLRAESSEAGSSPSGATGQGFILFTLPSNWNTEGLGVGPQCPAIFTRCVLQVFRTPTPSTDLNGQGNLFLEQEIEIPRMTGVLFDSNIAKDAYVWQNRIYGTSVADRITAGDVSVGDVIYIMWSSTVEVGDTSNNSISDVSGAPPHMLGRIFRRTIIALGANYFQLSDPSLPDSTYSEDVDIPGYTKGMIRWCISRERDEDDSSGIYFNPLHRPDGVTMRGKAGDSFTYTSYDSDWIPCAHLGLIPTTSKGQVRWNSYVYIEGDNETARHLYNVSSPLPPDASAGLLDDSLVVQEALQPEEFAIPPKGNPAAYRLEVYDDVHVMVSMPSFLGGSGEQQAVRWGFVDKPRKGLIPTLNKRRVSDLSSQVLALRNSETFLVVILDNALWRLHRSGSRMAVDVIHNQYGATSEHGHVVVGSTLYMTSSVGILVCDLTSGQLDVLGATQHFFDESGRWADDLSVIEASYDARLGAVIFFNPTKFECLLIWLTHGIFTHLIDVPFDRLVTRDVTDIQVGGVRRCLFYNAIEGAFYEIDAFREQDARTTASNVESRSWNGIGDVGPSAHGGVSDLVNDGNTRLDEFKAGMLGHFVRLFEKPQGPEYEGTVAGGLPGGQIVPQSVDSIENRARIIKVFNSQILVLDGNLGVGTVLDKQYHIGAIPFQITSWPLYGDPNTPVLDLFRAKKVEAMGAAIADPESSYSKDIEEDFRFLYQLFGRDALTPILQDQTEPLVASGEDEDQPRNRPSYVGMRTRATILVPGLECWTSNVDFDLLGMIIEGTIEGTKWD